MLEMLQDLLNTSNTYHVIIAVIIYYMLSTINALIKKVFSNKKSAHINTDIPLEQHDIFNYLDDLINYRVQTYNFKSEKRKQAYITYLTIINKTISVRYKKLLHNELLLTLNASELQTTISDEIKNTIEDYNGKAREIGIPEILIQRVHEYYAEILAALIIETGVILSGKYYESNYAKITQFLNLYKFSMIVFYAQLKATFDSLNGELDDQLEKMELKSIIL